MYPGDYRSRAVFGNYPYLFNISLQFAGNPATESIGDVLPDGYGYVRRVVELKVPSNATIDSGNVQQRYQSTANVTTHFFTIQINSTDLLANATNPACTNPLYQIDPWDDQITVNLTNLIPFMIPIMIKDHHRIIPLSTYLLSLYLEHNNHNRTPTRPSQFLIISPAVSTEAIFPPPHPFIYMLMVILHLSLRFLLMSPVTCL